MPRGCAHIIHYQRLNGTNECQTDGWVEWFIFMYIALKLRKAGVYSRVDDSNTSIGKRYARNDELGTPFGLTLDFACKLPSFFLSSIPS